MNPDTNRKMSEQARAHVQATVYPWEKRRPSGTIAWDEHELAVKAHRKANGSSLDAVAVNDRGGFSYEMLVAYLGHPPVTWRPSRSLAREGSDT